MDDPFRRTAFGAAVFYKDPLAALDWLERAFGFQRVMVIRDQQDQLVHSEMRFGDSYLMVGSEWADFTASPASIGGKNTQTVHVHLRDGLDQHCERARAAGAVILREPQDEFYGDRSGQFNDPWGHRWNIATHVEDVPPEEMAERAKASMG